MLQELVYTQHNTINYNFRMAKFHSLCDGKSSTLSIVKATTGYIFGGYASLPWKSSGGHKKDKTAFIYSLTNEKNLPSIIKVKTGGKDAVCHYLTSGLALGDGDLHIVDFSNVNYESCVDPMFYDFPKEIHDPSKIHSWRYRCFFSIAKVCSCQIWSLSVINCR